MLDLTQLVKRYFTVKLPNGQVLDVEVPKVKVLKKIMQTASEADEHKDGSGTEADIMASLTEGLSLALSKNKQNFNVSVDFIEQHLDYDEIEILMVSYFEWVAEVQSSKN